MIELIDIKKSFKIGDTYYHALKGINLRIRAGELVTIMGASGSGKTTTMNILGLLDRPTSGQYLLKGTDVTHLTPDQAAHLRNQEIGFIFQLFFLLPRLNALQNVALPLTYRNVDMRTRHEHAMAMLEKVGMANHAMHKPGELSGGQQQRVAFARALVGSPHLILADEPTGALDSKTSKEVLELLINLNQQEKTTIVIITHDPTVASLGHSQYRIADGIMERLK